MMDSCSNRLRRRFRPLNCEVCGSPLSPVRVRLEAGTAWSGPRLTRALRLRRTCTALRTGD